MKIKKSFSTLFCILSVLCSININTIDTSNTPVSSNNDINKRSDYIINLGPAVLLGGASLAASLIGILNRPYSSPQDKILHPAISTLCGMALGRSLSIVMPNIKGYIKGEKTVHDTAVHIAVPLIPVCSIFCFALFNNAYKIMKKV